MASSGTDSSVPKADRSHAWAVAAGAAVAMAILAAVRRPAPTLTQRMQQAARERAESRLFHSTAEPTSRAGPSSSAGAASAASSAAARDPEGQRSEAPDKGEQSEQRETSSWAAEAQGSGAHENEDVEAQNLAREREEQARLRREYDRYKRAFSRYQGQNRQQQHHHFYWDGHSFGHGWDEEREKEEAERRRQAGHVGGHADMAATWHAEHWHVLGLDMGKSRHVTASDIKAAFRAKALEHHPDRNPSDPEGAAVNFRKVLRAYEVLSRMVPRRSWTTACLGSSIWFHST